jgi:glyoxylase-like metal-dependent hydrolase (beta-lactamase superfamily II)
LSPYRSSFIPLTINTLALGPLETNCYVLRSGEACWVVDPGLWPVELLDFLEREKLRPQKILLTHGHGDHIAGIGDLRERFGKIVVACPAPDADMLTDAALNLSGNFGMPLTVGPADELIRPGDLLTCGQSVWQVLDTSGHTSGGVSFYCEKSGAVIVGDALFAGSIGRCDLPGGDMARLIANIDRNLLTLPPETRVLPGHGEETTIAREKESNPYL